jgi:glucose-6-phosphate 1-dehydrogenase
VELSACHESGTERPPYERLIGDATKGDQSLFAREDAVEAAWRVVDGILDDRTQLHEYEPGTWGPEAATGILARGDRWHDPVVTAGDASIPVQGARPATPAEQPVPAP